MSWQLVSLVLLCAALGCGFAWYEHSRPPAKVLALIAALSALAVTGRIAFAAIPNVKPTTDIVLLAGYALGGAPGFAVGAVTALVSNIFFAQGPWTPWQMAAWGGVGIAGGALRRLAHGRELGRWPLAIACAAAGIGFGLVMDTYQWTLTAGHDLASFVAVSGTSLPYNGAHVVGNAIFCLIFGVPLVRSLRRYCRRFEVRWDRPAETATTTALLVGALALGLLAAGISPRLSPALAAQPAAKETGGGNAAGYLERAQNADGGFGSARGRSSDPLFSGWAALGLAAAGGNPTEIVQGRRSVVDYLRTRAGRLTETGEIERTVLVLRAAGLSPRRFGKHDLIKQLRRSRRRDGSFDRLVNLTAFGILALRAGGERAGSPLLTGSARWLVGQQNDDGGYGSGPRGGASDVDDTGAVLQALAATGRDRSRAVRRAVVYLGRARNPDGGFGQMSGGASNSQSTAWAIQGLVAVGRDPAEVGEGSRTPFAFLRSLQGPNGSIRYSRKSTQTPVWVTAQALIALERKPFPLAPVARPGTTRSPALDQSAAEALPGDPAAKTPLAGNLPTDTKGGAKLPPAPSTQSDQPMRLSPGAKLPSPDAKIPSPNAKMPSAGAKVPSPNATIPGPNATLPSPGTESPKADGSRSDSGPMPPTPFGGGDPSAASPQTSLSADRVFGASFVPSLLDALGPAGSAGAGSGDPGAQPPTARPEGGGSAPGPSAHRPDAVVVWGGLAALAAVLVVGTGLASLRAWPRSRPPGPIVRDRPVEVRVGEPITPALDSSATQRSSADGAPVTVAAPPAAEKPAQVESGREVTV